MFFYLKKKYSINTKQSIYFRIELYEMFQNFMQEQEIDNINHRSTFYVDYRPYIRQICQNELIRVNETNSRRR